MFILGSESYGTQTIFFCLITLGDMKLSFPKIVALRSRGGKCRKTGGRWIGEA
jgi:hypothetical protein